MTEHPIIFSAEMVRAILDGRKTMTRRVVKPQPFVDLNGTLVQPSAGSYPQRQEYWKCSYGQPGDRLWVREGWGYVLGNKKDLVFRASIAEGLFTDRNTKWRSPIFMPRSASRITLEITAVRVERVQDIRLEDALAEGFPDEAVWDKDGEDYTGESAIDKFQDYWDSLNAKRGFGWDANPWCWCVSFRRLP